MSKTKGFAAFVKKTNPRPTPPSYPTPEKPAKKLLPNGFYVGEQVYYLSTNNEKVYGTVVDHYFPFIRSDIKDVVWANWKRGDEIGWMPRDQVYFDFREFAE